MQLHTLDWVVIAITLLICFAPAFLVARRSGKSTADFFASGRSVPWWLAGLSMVATTFSSDTPNLVTDIVRRTGVAGNWVWWAFVLTGVATVFFYARLWRRSGVLTDLEFYEIRYSGSAASAVRGFRAVYLGLLFNCMIMATVNLAACKIAGVLFGLERWQTLAFVGVLNVVFAAHSGLWGVLVIDMVQFFIKMTAVIAAAYFALQAPQVGGLSQLIAKLSVMRGPNGIDYLNILPDFTNNWDIAIAVFIMPVAVQWWAVWYPGSEPGGGSYIGLMVGGLIAANSSTILTHLNWGASYLVHDFYRRFIRVDADDRHYVQAGRVMTVILFLASSSLVFFLDTAKGAFDVILQIGA